MDMLVTMSTFQECILLGIITLISGFSILYAIYIYWKDLSKKAGSPPETDKTKEGSRKRRLFGGLEPQVILAVFAIAFIVILIIWYLYYNYNIVGFTNDVAGVTPPTGTISEVFKELLYGLLGCATFFISLAFVVIKVSTSAFSIRVFEAIFNPLNEKRKFIWAGVVIYILAISMCLILVLALSFQWLGLSDLQTLLGFVAIFLLLIHCVVAFEILGLFFVRAVHTTQSDHIINTERNRISGIYNNNRKENPRNDENKDKKEVKDKEEVENSLQLISNIINLSIQQYDSRSSERGIKCLVKIMENRSEHSENIQNEIIESCTRKMINSTRVALLQGDEITAINIIKTLGNNSKEHFLSNKELDLLIESYSDLGLFSVERNYIRSASECIEVLKDCNEKLFDTIERLGLREPPEDTTDQSLSESDKNVEKNPNPYDLSVICVKSASLVSQIADKRNYETLVVKGAMITFQMHDTLCSFLKEELPGLSSSSDRPLKLPKKLLSHYIWSIEDAGVSAANSNLEWGAIKYIECLEGFGENIFRLTEKYKDDENVRAIAILMTHISTAIRNIGQQLAKEQFQEGTIRAMSAIKKLASMMLTQRDMIWIDEYHTNGQNKDENLGEDTTEKLAFVRAVWNIKDIGRVAAENGIEKAVVLAADKLFILLGEALKPNAAWDTSKKAQDTSETEPQEWLNKDPKKPKKTEGLLSIGEGFYEISMIAREKRLQDALTKIIYYNVISVKCLAGDNEQNSGETPAKKIDETPKDYDEMPVLNIYLKTFVDLQLVDEFKEENVRAFFKTLTLDQKSKSYNKYNDSIDSFSERICAYCSQRSSQQPPSPDTQADKVDLEQEPVPHEESVLDDKSYGGKP